MRTMNVKGLTLFHLKSHLQVRFHSELLLKVLVQLIDLMANSEILNDLLFVMVLMDALRSTD